MADETEGFYLQRLLELFRRTKEKFLTQLNVSSHSSPDLIPALQDLWQQAQPQLSSTIDENFELLLNEVKMKEKLMELQKLCDKYSNLPPAWQYSGVPENDCNHFTEMAAKDVLPLYKELCQKEEEETQRLLQEYQDNLSLLTQLKANTEAQLTAIETTLAT